MTSATTKPPIASLMLEMGRYLGRIEAGLDVMHTCPLQHLRYPWPPEPDCDSCRRGLERFVERNHLEMAYRLFGWDVIVDHYNAEISRRAREAAARRDMGAGI